MKCALYRIGSTEEQELWRMDRVVDADGAAAMLASVLEQTRADRNPPADVVGHRVVHGGPNHYQPTIVDDQLLDDLRAVSQLAPLHLPAAIACMELVRSGRPDLLQVACFDTAFHADMPEPARRLPIPARLHAEGVRRYGFHGLSYEFVVAALGADRLGRSVLAHLGSGASMTAVSDGSSIDTTMGLTPSGGLVMSTRTGDIDPGVLVYLVGTDGYDANRLADLVEHRSGLLGVSETTGDMRTLLHLRPTDTRAALAVAMFCVRAKCQIGAYAALLGGLDSVVFTGGIGEHSPEIRAQICDGLEHLGVDLDEHRNAENAPVVSTDRSACRVHVIATNEDLVVTRHAARLANA